MAESFVLVMIAPFILLAAFAAWQVVARRREQ